jgi:hypothetical protein
VLCKVAGKTEKLERHEFLRDQILTEIKRKTIESSHYKDKWKDIKLHGRQTYLRQEAYDDHE